MINKLTTISLKSVSQVFFIENIYTGILILIGIGYTAVVSGNYALFFAAIIGAILSNVVAIYHNYDENILNSGLYGFNGVLLAMAVALFIEHSPLMWFIMIIGVYLATIVTNSLNNTITKTFGIPGSTGPFVFSGWLILFAAYQFSLVSVITGIHPHFISNFSQTGDDLFNYINLTELFFRNIGQVYFLGEPLSGVIILIGLFVGNKIYGGYAALGSLIAIITSIIVGVDYNVMMNGLYGFSSVLTAMALGCVFIGNNFIYAIFGAIVTVFLQASLYSLTESFAVPSFTSAYVLCMYLFVTAYRKKEG